MDSISETKISHKIDELHYEVGDMKKKVLKKIKPKKSVKKTKKTNKKRSS